MTISELRRMHTDERKSLLNKRRIERAESSVKHQGSVQESRLVNADPITRATTFLANAKALNVFMLNYLKEWEDMERRHINEVQALAEKLLKSAT